MANKVVKIYFSENDLQDMQSSFYKEEGLWNTWGYTDPKTGETTEVEMHLGDDPSDNTED